MFKTGLFLSCLSLYQLTLKTLYILTHKFVKEEYKYFLRNNWNHFLICSSRSARKLNFSETENQSYTVGIYPRLIWLPVRSPNNLLIVKICSLVLRRGFLTQFAILVYVLLQIWVSKRAFQRVVQSSFVFGSNNCYWPK